MGGSSAPDRPVHREAVVGLVRVLEEVAARLPLRVRLVAVLAGSRSAGPAPAADLRPVSPVDSHSGTVLPAPMPKGGMEQAPCIAFGQVGEHVPRRRRPAIGTRD